MRRRTHYQRTLQEILDSDDELSIDYVETPYVPAYQDDTRFEYLEKIRTKETLKNKANVDKRSCSTEISKVKLLKRGIFNKKDLLCLQCVQKMSNDTVLWFFNFLMFKELQSNYKFLKSCLVPKYEHYDHKGSQYKEYQCNENQTRYKLIYTNN